MPCALWAFFIVGGLLWTFATRLQHAKFGKVSPKDQKPTSRATVVQHGFYGLEGNLMSKQIIEARPRPAVVTPLVPRDRLLRLPDVSAIVGIRKSSIYALMRANKFPKCVYITSKTVAWPESAVLAWVNDRINKGAV